MASTTFLRMENPTPGAPAARNTWGTTENTGRTIIDAACAGYLSKSVAGAANVVLTATDGSLSESDYQHFVLTGVLTGNIYVLWPAYGRVFSVKNSTTGSFTLGLAVNNGGGAPAGSYYTIAQGETALLWSDGTNVYSRTINLPFSALADSSAIQSGNYLINSLTFIIDGGGAPLTTGVKGDLEIPFACTLNRCTMLADQSGSVVVDIWKTAYAAAPPTVANSITASAKPTISAATKSQDTTLTGWTTSISAGDVLRFNVDSASTVQRLTISLKATKT